MDRHLGNLFVSRSLLRPWACPGGPAVFFLALQAQAHPLEHPLHGALAAAGFGGDLGPPATLQAQHHDVALALIQRGQHLRQGVGQLGGFLRGRLAGQGGAAGQRLLFPPWGEASRRTSRRPAR